MKLKKAKKLAKRLNLSYIAVDKDNGLWAYKDRPHIESTNTCWLLDRNVPVIYHVLGKYTGSKHWTKTLREVV